MPNKPTVSAVFAWTGCFMGKHSLYRSRVDCRMAFTNSGTHSTENKLLFLVYGAVVAKHIFLQKRIVYKSFFMNDKLILDNEKRKKI